MAARKLQGEVERTLKKINEGIVEFEGVLTKIRTASTTNQKEKLESDLKRDIKKLQRLREQVKAWQSGNDVKDKGPLVEARKRIEVQMETFKDYEKKAKTKAYSKEGLQRQRDQEIKGDEGRRDITEWIQDRISELKLQIEVLEGEVEAANQEPTKKGKRGASQNSESQQHAQKMERHNYHLENLEKILRMWENEALDRDQVEGIKDSVDYYVDNNADDDFNEPEFIYDDLGLDDWDPEGMDQDYGEEDGEEDTEDASTATSSTTIDDAATESISVSVSKDSHQTSFAFTSPAAEIVNKESKPFSNSVSSAAVGTPKTTSGPIEAPKEPIQTSKNYIAPATTMPVTSSDSKKPEASLFTLPLDPTPAEAARAKLSSHHSSQPIQSIPQQHTPSQPTLPQHIPAIMEPANLAPTPSGGPSPLVSSQPTNMTSNLLQPTSHLGYMSMQGPSPSHPLQTGPLDPSRIPMGLQSRSTPLRQDSDSNDLLMAALKSSARYLPEPESVRLPYRPRNPATTPQYYPSTPAQHLLEDAATFSKYPADTLFFLFYFQQGTYQQYLAAKELKRQSWRYHTKYLTWFQRHEEPKNITNEFEMGTYVYFDYETGWCQRKKTEFTFQYTYLEDTELP